MTARRTARPNILFSSEKSTEWFNFVMRSWEPTADSVVMIPCASRKPYHKSITHTFFSRLWRMWLRKKINLVIISEPLTVVPAEYDYPEPKYPLYDYPPSFIKANNEFAETERKIWRKRLKTFLGKNSADYYFILYPYHKKILGDVLEEHAKGYYVERPYITRYVNRLIDLMKKL